MKIIICDKCKIEKHKRPNQKWSIFAYQDQEDLDLCGECAPKIYQYILHKAELDDSQLLSKELQNQAEVFPQDADIVKEVLIF